MPKTTEKNTKKHAAGRIKKIFAVLVVLYGALFGFISARIQPTNAYLTAGLLAPLLLLVDNFLLLLFVPILVAIPFSLIGRTVGATTSFIILLIAIKFLFEVSTKKRRIIFSGLDVAILSFIFIHILSVIHEDLYIGLWANEFETIASAIILFYLIINYATTKETFNKMLNATYLSVGIMGFYAILQLFFFNGYAFLPGNTDFLVYESAGEGVRVGTTIGSYSVLGIVSALTLLPAIFSFLYEKRKHIKNTYLALIVILVTGVLFSVTRTIEFGLMLALIYIAYIAGFKLKGNLLKIGTVAVILIVLFSFTNYIFGAESSLSRFSNLYNVRESVTYRQRLATDGLLFAMEYPFIGHGSSYWDNTYLTNLNDAITVHNYFVRWAIKIGFVGLAIYIWILIQLFLKAKRALSKGGTDRELWLKIAALQGGIITMLPFALTDAFGSRGVTLIQWTLFGLMIAGIKILEKQQPANKVHSLETKLKKR